jgi:hypothetical protein
VAAVHGAEAAAAVVVVPPVPVPVDVVVEAVVGHTRVPAAPSAVSLALVVAP